jgi:hypothetical protein
MRLLKTEMLGDNKRNISEINSSHGEREREAGAPALAGRGFAGGGGDPLTGTGVSSVVHSIKALNSPFSGEKGRLRRLGRWRGRREPH